MTRGFPSPPGPRFTRRALLGAGGAALALPFLRSLGPSGRDDVARAADEVDVPLRLLTVHLPNGVIPSSWRPAGLGAAWTPSAPMSRLARHKGRLLAISGLRSLQLDGLARGQDDPHGLLAAALTTGENPYGAPGGAAPAPVGPTGGRSFDRFIVDAIGAQTRIGSLELTSEGVLPRLPTIPCACAGSLSYDGPQQPRASRADLADTWTLITDPLGTGQDPVARAAVGDRRLRVLSAVHDDARRVRARLGAEDRDRLDGWLNAVDEVSRSVDAARAAPGCADDTEIAALLDSGTTTIEQHTSAMLDLAALALQCDATRVVTYMFGNEGSRRLFPELNLYEEHHFLSHHGNNPSSIAAIEAIVDWQMQQLARLLDRLDATPAEDGTPLLNHTIVLVLGAMGDPNLHEPVNLPALVCGAGRLRHDEHVEVEAPVVDLLSTICEVMGAPVGPIGQDGTGPLPELLA